MLSENLLGIVDAEQNRKYRPLRPILAGFGRGSITPPTVPHAHDLILFKFFGANAADYFAFIKNWNGDLCTGFRMLCSIYVKLVSQKLISTEGGVTTQVAAEQLFSSHRL